MKIYLSALTTLFAIHSITIYAEDCCMPEYRPGEPLCDDACAIYSQYAGVELNCGWNVIAWGEFLYWRPIPNTVIQTITFEGTPPGSLQLEIPNNYAYRPAFRVGLGWIAPCFDNWIFNIDYTWIHQHFKKTDSRQDPITLASTVGFFPIPQYSSIETKTNFNYDIVGLNVQRPNYLGQRVVLSPFLGLKWLKRSNKLAQDLLIAGTDLVDHQHVTISYTSIGLGAGFDGNWLLCWNLRLIGKADVAILYAYKRSLNQLNTSDVQTGVVPYPLRVKQHDRHLDIYGKGGMGIGWGSYFCCQSFYVDLSATFDYMVDVVKMGTSSGMWSNGTTQFVGLTLRGQLDF